MKFFHLYYFRYGKWEMVVRYLGLRRVYYVFEVLAEPFMSDVAALEYSGFQDWLRILSNIEISKSDMDRWLRQGGYVKEISVSDLPLYVSLRTYDGYEELLRSS